MANESSESDGELKWCQPKAPSFSIQDPEFDKVKRCWAIESEDGTEWNYDPKLGRWKQDLKEIYYNERFDSNWDNFDKISIIDEQKNQSKQKRKQKCYDKPKKECNKIKSTDFVNRAVYVTGLPNDVTVQELESYFSKCGIIHRSKENNIPRIKIYLDEVGNAKGDALIVYLKPESITLAIQMLDGSQFRTNYSVNVQVADSSYRKTVELEKSDTAEQKRYKIKLAKLHKKLADWDEPEKTKRISTSRVVVIKHMFALDEISDPLEQLQLKNEILIECEKLGTVTSIFVYDEEPDGIVTVKFANVDAALKCVDLMNGRWFAGKKLEVNLHDGRTKYRRSDQDMLSELERLDRFANHIENSQS